MVQAPSQWARAFARNKPLFLVATTPQNGWLDTFFLLLLHLKLLIKCLFCTLKMHQSLLVAPLFSQNTIATSKGRCDLETLFKFWLSSISISGWLCILCTRYLIMNNVWDCASTIPMNGLALKLREIVLFSYCYASEWLIRHFFVVAFRP